MKLSAIQAGPPGGQYLTRPADRLVDAIAVVTHSNMSPGVQGSGNSSTNPYGPTTSAGWISLLTSLGIRHIRDDATIDLANLKGGDTSTAAALAHQLACYQTLQSLGIKIGTQVKTPEALYNLVNTIIPGLASPLEWIENLNEESTSYYTTPASWTQYSPPSPYSSAGWGTNLNSNAHWYYGSAGISVPAGAVISSGGQISGDALSSASVVIASTSTNVVPCATASTSMIGQYVPGGSGSSNSGWLPSGGAYISAVVANTSVTLVSTPGGSTAVNPTATGTFNMYYGGLKYGGIWYCVTAHTTSYATHPDAIVCAGNGGGAGSTGGEWLDQTYSGPWVPVWAAHSVLLCRLQANLRAQGLIPSATLINDDAASNDIAHNTWIAAAALMYGTAAAAGADLMHTHNYGTSTPTAAAVVQGQLSAVGATTSATAAARLAAFTTGAVLGENGAASKGDTASELSIFENLMRQMVDAYRTGLYRACTYELTDYTLTQVNTAWASPIDTITAQTSAVVGWAASTVYATGAIVTAPSYSNCYYRATTGGTSGASTPANIATPPAYGTSFSDGGVTWKYIGQWETYGLAALNDVVLNGTASHDFRQKNGWSYLANFITAVSDGGKVAAPKGFQVAIGSLSSLSTPLVLNRVNGQIDIIVYSTTGSTVTGVTATEPSGVTWSGGLSLIDPATGSTPVAQTPSGSVYTLSVPVYPVIWRITP